MHNLNISLLELIIKGIPETCIFVYAVLIITQTKFNAKRYIFFVSILILSTYVIRNLPIKLGADTLLCLLIMLFGFIYIFKIDAHKAFKSLLSLTIILLISECINILVLYIAFGKSSTTYILLSPQNRTIYSIPSTLIFGLIIYIYNKILKQQRKVSDNSYGKNRS